MGKILVYFTKWAISQIGLNIYTKLLKMTADSSTGQDFHLIATNFFSSFYVIIWRAITQWKRVSPHKCLTNSPATLKPSKGQLCVSTVAILL